MSGSALAPDIRLQEAGAWCVRVTEGGLDPAEQQAFERWLEADPDNAAAFDDAMAVWRTMEEMSLSPELIDIRRASLDSFRRANRSKWRRGLSHHWRAALAACLALVMVIGAGLWWRYSPRAYETGVGERRVVMLSDGSRLSLDAATRVSVRYLGDKRDLRLERGRAKFDVAKDPLRPFAVTALDKVVVATGTAFSVEVLNRQVRVILYEGHVAVLAQPPGQARPRPVRLASRPIPAEQVLTPGRELVAAADQATAEVAQTDAPRTLSWEGGQLVFVDEPLASAVERVNRYSTEKLVIGDPAAGRTPINGVYTAGDTAAFVEGVTGVAPVVVRDEGERKAFFLRR